MCECLAYMYVRVLCADFMLPEITRGHWIPWDLSEQLVMSLHVGAGSQTWVLCKKNRCSLPLSPSNIM